MKKNVKNADVNELKKQLLSFRMIQATSGHAKPHEKKKLKKEISRMLTGNKK